MMLEKMSFKEKLEIINEIFFDQHKHLIEKNEMICIENKLQIVIPEAIREFYLMFGSDLALLKCMYNIASPNELCIVDGILIIAKEYQNVCSYGMDIYTQKVIYLDESNHVVKNIELDIEDFLIYLLAVQGTEFFSCIGKVNKKFIDRFEKYLLRVSKVNGEGAIYCGKDRMICVVTEENIFLSAKSDDIMEKFEMQSELEIDYL